MIKEQSSKVLVHDSLSFSPHMALAFDICGALLIQQIHYWITTKGHTRNGHKWCFNTYEEWVKQLMVYGRSTIVAKMKELESVGVIVSGKFNKLGYDKTKWYRVDYAVLAKVIQDKLPKHKVALASSSKNWTIDVSEIGRPIPETTTKTNKKIISSAVTTSPLPGTTKEPLPLLQVIPGKEDIDTPEDDEEAMAKVHNSSMAILAGLKAKKDSDVDTTKSNPQALSLIWVTSVPKYHEGSKFMKSFTNAEMGKLSILSKEWGKSAGAVLHCLIKDWVAFTHYAESVAGAYKTPLAPSLPLVVKYREAAMNFYLSKKASENEKVKLKNVSGSKAVGMSGKVQSEVNCTKPTPTTTDHNEVGDEDDQPTTLEFLLKFKGGKNDGKGSGT